MKQRAVLMERRADKTEVAFSRDANDHSLPLSVRKYRTRLDFEISMYSESIIG